MKKLINRFALVLDSSGSMLGIAAATVDAFNANVAAIRDGSKAEGQTSTVTYLTFSEYHRDVNLKFEDVDVDNLKPLARGDFYPQGTRTALWDATKNAVATLERLPFSDSRDVANVLFVVTDGDDNASWTSVADLRRTIDRVNATGHWSLVFLLPRGRKNGFCRATGIPEGNVAEWDQTVRGVETAQKATSLGITSFLRSRSQGKTSTTGFFVTDMSKVSASTVKKSLDDISSAVVALPVERETMIAPFVERKLGNYVKGNGFYQLTKDETVQPYKQILLMEKGKTAVYGGTDARQLLGLPDGLSVKVRPGNHANWDIFVQSTSVNRKLVRGTKLLVVK